MAYPEPIDLTHIEADIVTRLISFLQADITAGNVEVELLPDQAAPFKRPISKKGRISVCYLSAKFDKNKAIGSVVQDRFNLFGIYCSSKTRLGAWGVNDLAAKALEILLGYAPLNHEKLVAEKSELYMREVDTAIWFERLDLTARSMAIEFKECPVVANIVDMTFQPDDSMPVDAPTVVVNADTEIGDNPII